MTTFTIDQKNLKAVSYAMASKDARYWLCGVFIEHNGCETRLVATDGHRLHMVIEDLPGLMIEPISFIMPLDMVKTCVKAKAPRYDKNPQIHLTYDQGKIEARLPDGSTILHMAIDGTFPDYTRVIPSDSSFNYEPAVFNCEYMLDAENALKDYLEIKKSGFATVGIAPRGNSCGILSVPGFTAVIMPQRSELTTCADLRMTQKIAKPENVVSLAA